MYGCSGTCSSCSQSIPASEFVMKVQGHVYHLSCFSCASCHNRLVPGDKYTLLNGNIICEHDYPKVVKGISPMPPARQPAHKVSTLYFWFRKQILFFWLICILLPFRDGWLLSFIHVPLLVLLLQKNISSGFTYDSEAR